ncbi:ADP-ribosyltransferase [Serratia ureilytica]|uniref:ADP-ribosyltransferase n=1 Tax=Serratia ureilytica TaxID=300181 RepID=UPI00257876A6|nr:ADP-ribosyltransferase [Serratia ureilytica]MDM1845399.1 ADP-ribosyltransferase [Serratia ureilytica]
MPTDNPQLQQAIAEFNKAIIRAAEYEGNIENIIRDKVERLFPAAEKSLKESVVAQAVEKIAEANQAFEFNHLGNDLLEFPAVEYIARSFLRRTLEKTAIVQARDPAFSVAKNNPDAGIGFLDGWSSDNAEWAKQMNALLNESKVNARVLTSLAYSYIRPFRNPQTLRKLGGEANESLLDSKEANPRLDIFAGSTAGASPAMSKPITTQPHGWPWLKYVDWNATEALGNKTSPDLIGGRPSGDPHKGTGFKFKGMLQAIKPPPYRRHSFSLRERDEHESGYGGFVINDKSMTSIGAEKPLVVNWRQQNMNKKLPMFSGPSSTTSYMYEIARLLNLPAAEAQAFRLLLLGWMIQARDHSFTEIMGALDAYTMEFDERGPTSVPSDANMAWGARQSGDWLRAYEDLVTEDIDLPALEAKTLILEGQAIHLPAQGAVHISRDEFDQFITAGRGYPAQYASDDYLLKIGEAAASGGETEDISGLASERILYAPQNREDLKLYNVQERKLPPHPARGAPGTPFLDAEKDAAVTTWLDALPEAKRAHMLNAAASLLAESTQQDSLGHVFNYGNRNDIWEVFLTQPGTNMLAGQLKLDPFYYGEDPFVNLLDRVSTEKTPQARASCLLDAIGDGKQNQDILLKGMLLAVTRFYTANGANVINPGYGGFAPPKNAGEMESRLQALLKRNQYLTSGQRSQAKSEYRQTVELLHRALESPMFERYSGTLWHGSHAAVAEALLEQGNNARFPGFMSATYDPAVAKSYMAKGALIVVKPGEVSGSLVEGISNAPGEKEVLFPEGTPFSVEQSYVLHLEKGYPPEANSMIKKKRFDFEVANGSKLPYVKVRVTGPGQTDGSDPEGERELASLIEQLKTGSVEGLEPETKVVVLRPRASEEAEMSEALLDVALPVSRAEKAEVQMIAR